MDKSHSDFDPRRRVEIHSSSISGSRLADQILCQGEKSLSHLVSCDFERSGRLECIATLGQLV